MPVVTDIKQTKKGKYALFCDGEFRFSLELDTIIERKIEIGMELEEFELSALEKLADLQKATNKALYLLSHRMHSGLELRQKMLRLYDQHTVDFVIYRLASYGYINDDEYADEAIRNHIPRKNMSYKAAIRYLEERGIDTDDPNCEVLLDEYAEGELERIHSIITKKYINKLGVPKSRQNVIAALVRKGFSVSDIRRVLADMDFDTEEEY